MSFTTADFIAMQARLQKNLKRPTVEPDKTVREIGKGGIQDQIEEYLKSHVPKAWWDRKRTDRATTSRLGVPDFQGVFHGIAFAIEVKRPGEKPTTEQLGELKWLELAGARTAVVYSKQEAVDFFDKLSL